MALRQQSSSYDDSEDVLSARLMVQPLDGVDGAHIGVDAEQTHAVGVYGALQRVSQTVMLVTVRRQHLDHLGIGRSIFGNGHVVRRLGEDGRIVVVVQNSDVDLK